MLFRQRCRTRTPARSGGIQARGSTALRGVIAALSPVRPVIPHGGRRRLLRGRQI